MHKDIPKTYNLSVEFGKTFENIGNSGFKKGTCRIAYAGKNRNYSDIPKESFEKALNSLALIPIVGNFKDGNFHGHDVAIQLEGNDISFIDLTSPIGVVPETHNAQWVDVEDENGNVKKYLQADVIFWFSRNPEPVQFIIDNGYVGQSMEIENIFGDWTEDGYFRIDDFQFSALCLLGTDDENPENDVEPCFEESQVTISQFSLNKDEFKSNFSQMMSELKNAYKENAEEPDTTQTEDFTEEVVEDSTTEETETTETTEVEMAVTETEETDDTTEDVAEEEVIDYASIIDGLNLQVQELTIQINTLNETNNNLQTENSQLKTDNAELSSFKSNILQEQRELQEDELFEKYDQLIDVEDESYKKIKENKSNYSIEQLKKEIAFIFAEKKINFSSNNNKKIIKLGGDKGNTGEVSPYGNLFEKHLINKKEEK